jgi:23S rRNA (cytidine1920-2'-O)/16S rRNA (cytidine1409-2'-O)-methyltransferase
VLAAFAQPGEMWQGEVVLLIKPQFEAGREHVGKGGIVRTQAARQLAINRVAQSADSLGAREIQVIDSPIKGMEGNHEYLLHAAFGEDKA